MSFRVEAVRSDLETCGIDDITVFPDLEGLSRTVERKWRRRKGGCRTRVSSLG